MTTDKPSLAPTGRKPGRETKPPVKAPLGRHMRKCAVCRHRDRDAIELEFLRWRRSKDIAEDYGIVDQSSIYRHARAAGLFEKRRCTVRLALEPFLEGAEHLSVTPETFIRAVRAYCSINDSGQWVEPAAHVVHHSSLSRTLEVASPVPAHHPAHDPALRPPSAPQLADPNRQIQELEGDLNA